MTASTATAETFGPEAPSRLFTYRFWSPFYRQMQTLDTFAVTRDHALERAQAFMQRQHKECRAPRHPNDLVMVLPQAGEG